jgi:phosphopantothenoylcysteine decarboxylase/phosphopantothenate--cysteine ligase
MACRILITGGGCEEPLDGVRFLANHSTGNTAISLARAFAGAGCFVDFLAAYKVPVPDLPGLTIYRFRTYLDIEGKMKTLLSESEYHLVIQAAAVSDYSIDRIETENGSFVPGEADKIDSNGDLRVILRRNGKIIDRIRDWSRNKKVLVVGFKLTNSDNREQGLSAVKKLFGQSGSDWIVWNDMNRITGSSHQAEIFSKSGESLGLTNTKDDLAKKLAGIFFKEMNQLEGVL